MPDFPWRPGVVGTHEQLNYQAFWKFATIAALAAEDSTNLPAYAAQAPIMAAVAEVGVYRYAPSGAATVDGYSVVDANGPGQWWLEVVHADLSRSIYSDINETALISVQSVNFGSVDPRDYEQQFLTVPGARVGDLVRVQPPDLPFGLDLHPQPFVSGKNQVTVRLYNSLNESTFKAEASVNLGSVSQTAPQTGTITLTGLQTTDLVFVQPPSTWANTFLFTNYWASAANTVSFTVGSHATTNDPAAQTYRAYALTLNGVLSPMLAGTLRATASLNFGSISAGNQETLTTTVTGAQPGDIVLALPPSNFTGSIAPIFSRVSAANTVSVTVRSLRGTSSDDPPAGVWNFIVWPASHKGTGLLVDATLDFPSVDNLSPQTLTVSVPGASVGDFVIVQPPTTLETGLCVTHAVVSSADTVSIRLNSVRAGSVNPASATYKVLVLPWSGARYSAAADWAIEVTKPNRQPAISVTGLRIYQNLLGGEYADGAALEAELGTAGYADAFDQLCAVVWRRQELLDDAPAKAIIQASTTANTIMESYEGAGY